MMTFTLSINPTQHAQGSAKGTFLQGGWYEGEWQNGERSGVGVRVLSSGKLKVVFLWTQNTSLRDRIKGPYFNFCGMNKNELLFKKDSSLRDGVKIYKFVSRNVDSKRHLTIQANHAHNMSCVNA